MERTTKEKLDIYKGLLNEIHKINMSFYVLDYIYKTIELEEEYIKDLDKLNKSIDTYFEYIKILIKEKCKIESILDKKIDNIKIEELLEL